MESLKEKRKKMSGVLALILGLLFCVLFSAACSAEIVGPGTAPGTDPAAEEPGPDPVILSPQASGTRTEENEKAVIDYSHVEDGYVMVRYKGETDKRLKVQVKNGDTTYVYNIKPGEWNVFPLSLGDGAYTVQCCENVEGNKYSVVLSARIDAKMTDEFAPFLRPNQYVDYAKAEGTLAQASRLVRGKAAVLEKVGAVYDYVVKNLKYDYDLAKTVKSGYLPDLEQILTRKKGICFDYASLMTAMLRSQGVPCKLVVGYAGEAYHAWINVWCAEEGWLEKQIYFDGKSWVRMDPTFASTMKSRSQAAKYVGDGSHYVEKFFY